MAARRKPPVDDSSPSTIGVRLLPLGYTKYADYLASDHWRKVKARYQQSDRPKTCPCGSKRRLQLHHLTYARLGREKLVDLVLLCADCHARLHELSPTRHRRSPRTPQQPAKRTPLTQLWAEYEHLKALAFRTFEDTERIRELANELLERRSEVRPIPLAPTTPRRKGNRPPKQPVSRSNVPQPWVARPPRKPQ